MLTRNLLVRSALAAVLMLTGVSIAQKKPAQNVSPRKHPNLAAAQRLSAQAYQKITAAQEANEWDLAGHAKHAKELLDQANEELKKAAEVSNVNHQ